MEEDPKYRASTRVKRERKFARKAPVVEPLTWSPHMVPDVDGPHAEVLHVPDSDSDEDLDTMEIA